MRLLLQVRAVGAGESNYAYSYSEVNWKANNNGNDTLGSATRTLSLTNAAYSTAQVKVRRWCNGTNAYAALTTVIPGFPSDGYYNQHYSSIVDRAIGHYQQKEVVFDFGNSTNGLGLRFNAGILQAGVANNNVRAMISSATLLFPDGTADGIMWLQYNQNSLKLFINGVEAAANNALSFSGIGLPVSIAQIGLLQRYRCNDNVI